MIIRWFGFTMAVVIWMSAISTLAQVYTEEYRPQFHFSPRSGWIGDPSGLMKYKDIYHVFWWGHATSSDLVFWNEQTWPMKGDDGTFDYYTGSVVVDEQNSSGFGSVAVPPMVAVYTANNKSTGKQDQRLSWSTDYMNFQYYTAGNPVLTSAAKEFRDPDIFWDDQTSRWIMSITYPLERQIAFYASGDLKSWQYLSTFGPMGAREQVWEVPSLARLPVDGDLDNRRWVMLCSMGPNRMQYFNGEFDGTNFTLDPKDEAYLKNGVGLPGDIFENFESSYGEWIVEGNAFGPAPSSGTLPNQGSVSGYFGGKLVNSYLDGDANTGKLTSPSFTITKNNINFLIGGGNKPNQACINLVINGVVARTSTGSDSEQLKWKGWDVSQYVGRTAKIEIVDNATGSWGHINVDHIMFSDVLMNTESEHANWVDWGADFYAARMGHNYDDPTSPVFFLGWMGNWEYANSVPTFWGRGAESIPREISLVTSDDGKLNLVQKPLPAFENLRGDIKELPTREITGTATLTEYLPPRNTYELEAVFELTDSNQDFGLNFFVGGFNKVKLGYNAAQSNIYLDRINSGNISFHSKFPKRSVAPFTPKDGKIKFHVFVDQSSIEVFVNDGALVMTSLVFPYSNGLGIETFSLNGQTTTMTSLKIWELASIWGIDPPGTVTGIEKKDEIALHVYPNPASVNAEVRIQLPATSSVVDVALLDVHGKKTHRGVDWIVEERMIAIRGISQPGLYVIRVQQRDRTIYQKLIVN